jgi:hypothetical protein
MPEMTLVRPNFFDSAIITKPRHSVTLCHELHRPHRLRTPSTSNHDRWLLPLRKEETADTVPNRDVSVLVCDVDASKYMHDLSSKLAGFVRVR